MHFKPLPATLVDGAVVAGMIFARALALLPLATGCRASRTWPPGTRPPHRIFQIAESRIKH
ncbi:MAG: hypothetical protein ACTHL1_02880 [Burkholderiaceae bacterium]